MFADYASVCPVWAAAGHGSQVHDVPGPSLTLGCHDVDIGRVLVDVVHHSDGAAEARAHLEKLDHGLGLGRL